MITDLENRLHKRLVLGNLRKLQLRTAPIDFSSNDYLGLARSNTLASYALQECRLHAHQLNGYGSTGSRLLTGNSLYAQELEEKIARFHGYEAGLLFSCGYMANVGLLSGVTNPDNCLFFDAAVHASTYDGIRLSRAKAFAFRHNDLEHLENRLKKCLSKGNRFICIESIYSQDGSRAPLVEISQLAKKYEANLIVDEAHATGVCGPRGKGLIAEYHLMDHVCAHVITFGKALGTYGAIVLGRGQLKQALVNFATSYIYTTALPLHNLAAISCSYDLFPKMDQERERIRTLIDLCNTFFPNPSRSHIQSVPIKGNQHVKQASEKLFNEGFDARALMSPTVQRGHEALRICLHAFNTKEELSRLFHLIQNNRV